MKRNFTLLEMLIVAAVIAILSGAVRRARRRQKDRLHESAEAVFSCMFGVCG